METVHQLLLAARARMKEAGISSAQEDTRLLLCHALGWSKEQVFARPFVEVTAKDQKLFEEFIQRRLKREPVSRIIGEREFWSLPFKISPHTLDPRPDSETIIEAVLSVADRFEESCRILDLGTGSGCLLLALLSEMPNATGVGIDQSSEALLVAQDNALTLGLNERSVFQRGDWGSGLEGVFDIILSNPPYIAQGDELHLEKDVVEYDPSTALFAGMDGLDDYRALMPDAKQLLAPKGMIFLEIGEGQETDVVGIMVQNGLVFSGHRRDIQGTIRCIIGEHKKA